MSSFSKVIDVLLAKPIAYHRIFALVSGGVAEGLFLSQAYYWSFRTSLENEWFYKSQDEWEAETSLTRREQEAARKKLIKLGVLQEKKEGLPCKLFFKLDREALYKLIENYAGSNPDGCQSVQSDKLDCCELERTDSNIPVNSERNNKASGHFKALNPDGCQSVQSDKLVRRIVQTSKADCTNNLYTENTSIKIPPTPQGEEKKEREENKFGFQIPEPKPKDVSSNQVIQNPSSTQDGLKTLHEQENFSSGLIVPLAEVIPVTSTKKISDGVFGVSKYERWARNAHPALVYAQEETPWLEAPTKVQFVVFHRAFVEWGGLRWKQQFHKADDYQAIGDFIASLKNDPDKIATRWQEYQSHMTHKVVVVQARLKSGASVGEDEQQKIIKHQRALIGVDGGVCVVNGRLIEACISNPPQFDCKPVGMCGETGETDVGGESQVLKPTHVNQPEIEQMVVDGYENIAMYTGRPRQEDSDFYMQLREGRNPMMNETANKKMIEDYAAQVFNAPKLQVEARQRLKEQEKQRTSVDFWNNLLASGIPSVMKDAERQARSAGYVVVNNQVCEPDF